MLLLLLKLYAVQGLFVKYERAVCASPMNTLCHDLKKHKHARRDFLSESVASKDKEEKSHLARARHEFAVFVKKKSQV